ncbi:hypothetical protein SKAU_G00031190 [Synaphobranchus kaupii]|uniref:AIG1-type G domain-containing protein n=1 Tax=Synaphobranchus kaupii TaxID=118154 RepID=A0A9Q1GEZ9_SYNKA|nr:hypothetical protein SKAU_G00031190 [Synaphobranchus kaupii]
MIPTPPHPIFFLGSPDLRIVLLGKTGAGRSSTANSILGEKLFKTSCSANSQTGEYKAITKTVDGRSITVIDTPGFLDNKSPGEILNPNIVECVRDCSSRPHTFVIVMKTQKQTAEEMLVMKRIEDWFGEEALKYAVVLFTNGDQLDDHMTIQQFVDKNGQLKSFVNKCGGRLHVIDNKYFSTDCSNENSDEELIAEIAKCIIECSPGPHAFVILLTVGRQTEEEKKVVETIQEMFGEEALKYAVVLFSHGDQLEDHETIQQFVNENNQLKTFAQMCGDRLHVIDNKYWIIPP